MATRYVWNRYPITVTETTVQPYNYSYGDTSYKFVLDYPGLTSLMSQRKPVYGSSGNPSYTINSSGQFTLPLGMYNIYQQLDGVTTYQFYRNSYDESLSPISKTYYFALSSTNANSFDFIYKISYTLRDTDTALWFGEYVGFSGKDTSSCYISVSASYGEVSSCSLRKCTLAKGTSYTNVSNSSSSAYPTDGASGSYWYTYQGSDSIDATAVGYSTQTPMGGQSITINVTPRANTYGGTIQYTYQVQLSGGSWTTIATKTTATSQQYTIPAGTTSFAARVVANDTWGFSSSSYTTGSTITVTNNLPPTAPGSISIGGVVGGQQCTITWTAATDPDGTIASYQLERQVDNGNTWTQIYSGAALTYDDTINADWATVNYRVKATDDDGDSGPYATGTMQTVNSGWLYFSGPPADMGSQPAPFDFVFSIGSTGASPATDISVAVIYDDETIYTGTVDADEQITLNIDTRLTYAGDHDIIVTAGADGFLAVTQQCDFTVPSVTLPNGGAAGFMEDDAGNTYYPATLARYVIGLKGLDANALFDRVYTGTYTGTGTSGSGNPCSVRTSFEPILVFIQAAAASTATSGYWVNSAPGQSSQGNMIVNNNGTVTLCPVTWDAEAMTLSWYGTSAAAQLNASGTVYGIIALGGMA